ncbi:MAG: hypothetical protein ACYC96_16085 [Fimbriimonadaceae bacterium]
MNHGSATVTGIQASIQSVGLSQNSGFAESSVSNVRAFFDTHDGTGQPGLFGGPNRSHSVTLRPGEGTELYFFDVSGQSFPPLVQFVDDSGSTIEVENKRMNDLVR